MLALPLFAYKMPYWEDNQFVFILASSGTFIILQIQNVFLSLLEEGHEKAE